MGHTWNRTWPKEVHIKSVRVQIDTMTQNILLHIIIFLKLQLSMDSCLHLFLLWFVWPWTGTVPHKWNEIKSNFHFHIVFHTLFCFMLFRYFAICHPTEYQRTKKTLNPRIEVSLSFFLAFVIQLPYFVAYSVVNTHCKIPRFHFNSTTDLGLTSFAKVIKLKPNF